MSNLDITKDQGCVTNDVKAKTLRAHKAASDERKSDQRDAVISSRASLNGDGD